MELSSKKRTLIFISLVLSCVTTTLLSTALTTALPAIIADLKLTATTGQWLTSGYSLAMGIAMPLSAFLIIKVPTKKLYLGTLGLFLVGTILAFLAQNFEQLMFARILQALSNGILTAMAQVILLELYPKERLGGVLGWYGLSVTAAPVIAPTLAGVIVDSLGWRAIFSLTAGVMVVVFLTASFIFEDVLQTSNESFDLISFILSTLTFGGLTLGLGDLGVVSFMSFSVLGMLLLGIFAGGFFVFRQLRLTEPFLDLRILKERTFSFSVVASMIMYLVMMGSSLIFPLYIQSYLGYSALISGLVILPGSLVMALISPLVGRLYDRFGIKKIYFFGSLLLFISSGAMAFVGLKTALSILSLLNALRCLAIGCLMMPLVNYGTHALEGAKIVHATALLTSLRTIAGAVGSAIFVSVMTIFSTHSSTSGKLAQIFGMHVSFSLMAGCALILLVAGIFSLRNKANS